MNPPLPSTLHAPSRSSGRWLLFMLGGLLLVAAAGVLLLNVLRSHRESGEARERGQEVDLGPRVTVVPVEASSPTRTVTLPGDVRAFAQATLYAKTAGYLKTIKVDKGDRVKKNQIIGIIESPETDQQVAAAKSDLAVKQQFANRARSLAPSGVVSAQDLERANSDLQVAEANLARAKALQDYEVLRAPFDGVVTARYNDMGALLQPQVPVVDVADADRVRVTVYVGQDVASFLKVGNEVTVKQDERPDQPIHGKITLLSTALDTRTRSMLAEVWLDNTQFHLYPGTFVHVAIQVTVPPLPTAPAEAVFMRGDKLMAAVVENSRVRFIPVEPGISDGKTVQMRQGPKAGELVALNFPSELSEGARIQPVEKTAEPAAKPAASR